MKKTGAAILIVDDDEDIRELLGVFLEGDGYSVRFAVDGLDAWHQLRRSGRPDLILLDWMMPRMDGEQFLKKLRASPFANVPVVIITGNHTAHQQVDRFQANCCLKKPIELQDLLSVIAEFITSGPGDAAAGI